MLPKPPLSSASCIHLACALVLGGCSGTDASSDDVGNGGTVAVGTAAGGTVAVGTATLAIGGATAVGTATQPGGSTSIGGTSSLGGSTSAGGTSSLGGTTATGGSSSLGGTTAKGGTSSLGGTTAKGGTSSLGGTTAKGGTSSLGGTTAKGGTSSLGGTTAKGGTSSTGGTTQNGSCTATGFHTKSGKIYDSKCNEFIMRGVNYPYAWYTSQNTNTRFSEIASVKSNTVRVVMSALSGTITSAANITSIIGWAKANKLIAMLELHDCTGWGDGNANEPAKCLAYWLRSDIINVLKGSEAYVMINIANEAFGNATTAQWAPFYQGAIPQMRTAGLRHTIVVDAPNWGQDWENVMRDGTGASTIFNADPDKNTIFSVHMYDVYSTSATVTSYFTNFLAKGLPFIVGEFAADHASRGNVDEDTILSLSAQRGVGYLGWSWSGNSADLASLDITNSFNLASLTTWGSRLINGANGISATGRVCSVYQ